MQKYSYAQHSAQIKMLKFQKNMQPIEIKRLRKKLGLSQTDFGKRIGVSLRSIQMYEKGNTKPSADALIKLIELNAQDDAYSQKDINHLTTEHEHAYAVGVPYYDLDVTSHITTSFNDVHESPSFYVDFKPFNDCTAYVNNYGDSMYPKYKNGEKLAVKQIFNFDVINWGETYLVITNSNANDMKTVKDVHPHEDLSKIILRASNPAYAGDTVINKEDILSMFAVKGKISQNFI